MKHFVVGVDWYGPYTRMEAVADARTAGGGGLYLAVGRTDGQRVSRPQYVGLSRNLARRLQAHHKLPLLRPDMRLWLGYSATAEQSGRRAKVTPRTWDDAEWCHAYFMALPLNERKAGRPPQQPVTVLNRWWHADGRPSAHRPHRSWPDLFDFIGSERRSRVVWFGGRVESYDLHDRDLTGVANG